MNFLKRNLGKKTFWAGVSAIAVGVGMIANDEMSSGIQSILVGVGLITGRDAITKLEG